MLESRLAENDQEPTSFSCPKYQTGKKNKNKKESKTYKISRSLTYLIPVNFLGSRPAGDVNTSIINGAP